MLRIGRGDTIALAANPAGDRRHGSCSAASRLKFLEGDRQDADAQLRERIVADLREQVLDVGVLKPLKERLSIRARLHKIGQVARGLVPQCLHFGAHLTVANRLGNGLIAAVHSSVREERVSAVKEPQLAVLVRLEVVREDRPGLFPLGALAHELPFDDPGGERFGHHRRGVLEAREFLGCFAVVVGGLRRDAVDRGRGHRHILFDPRRGLTPEARCVFIDHAARKRTIAGEVVTRHDRDRSRARAAARVEAEYETCKCGFELGKASVGLPLPRTRGLAHLRECLQICLHGAIRAVE